VNVLRVADLSVRVSGSHILQGVSFDVPPAGVTALLGRNGVGKTTTLRALLGLMPANAVVRGDAWLREQRVLGVPTFRLIRSGLAYVPEDRCVFAGLTVGENLRLAERRGEPADYDGVYALFPELSRRTAQRAGTLSGGQQQMVAIGRALMSNPSLLLCDELSLGLAPIVIREIYAALPDITGEGMTAVVVEQDVALAQRVSQRVLCLQEGRVSLEGRADSLTREQIAAAYFGN